MRVLLSFFIILLSASYLQAQKLKPKALSPKVDALVQEYIDLDIFSGVVLIADKGIPVYHKAFGMANREKQIPNTLETKFDIGSMNKSYTKVVIMKLVEKGQISLEDKLGKHLKGFAPEAAEKITIQHLLSHKSGVGSYFYPGYFESSKEEKSIASLVERIKKQPLMFPPGEEQEYSNSGYVVLGAIIEAVTGKSYYDNVREMIVDPMGLKNTYLEDVDKLTDRATGYFKNYKGELRNNGGFVGIPKPD